jgi:hypothetical protein
MTKQKNVPPVPPDNRSRKGTGEKPDAVLDDANARTRRENENIEQVGDHANIHQNTHNQGYQQDR